MEKGRDKTAGKTKTRVKKISNEAGWERRLSLWWPRCEPLYNPRAGEKALVRNEGQDT